MSFSLASFENRSTFDRVSVTSIGLIGIKQFTEARRTGYKDFKYNDLFTAAAAILKMDMYTVYKVSLMYYSLKHPVSVNLIKQKFFDVTPDHFVPTAEDIKHFIEEPQFMYRFSVKNYTNIKTLFKKSHPSFTIDICAITKDDSELVPYLKSKRTQLKENLKSKLHILKNINHDDYDFKRIQRVNEMFTFHFRAEESSNFLFSSDFYLHMMAPQCELSDFISTLLIGFSPNYHGGLYKEFLLQQNEKLQLSNIQKKNLKKKAKGKPFVDPPSYRYQVEKCTRKLKVPNFFNGEPLKFSFRSTKANTPNTTFSQNSLVKQIVGKVTEDACQPLFDVFSPEVAIDSSVEFLKEQRTTAILKTLPTNALPYLGSNNYCDGEYVYEHLKILAENYKKEVNINNHPLMLTDYTASYLTDESINFHSFYRLANSISKDACHIDKFKYVHDGLIYRTGWKFVDDISGKALAAGYRAAVYKELHNINYSSRIFTNSLTSKEKKLINKNIEHISYTYFKLFDENHQPIVNYISKSVSNVDDTRDDHQQPLELPEESLATEGGDILTQYVSTVSRSVYTTISTTQSLHLRYHSDAIDPIGEDEPSASSSAALHEPQIVTNSEDVIVAEEAINSSDSVRPPTADEHVEICENELAAHGHGQSNDFGDGNVIEELLIVQEQRFVDGMELIEADMSNEDQVDPLPQQSVNYSNDDVLEIIDAYDATTVSEDHVAIETTGQQTEESIMNTTTVELNNGTPTVGSNVADNNVIVNVNASEPRVDADDNNSAENPTVNEEVVSCTSGRSIRLESGLSVYTRLLYSVSTPNSSLQFPFHDPTFESILSLEEQELLRYLEPRSVAMKIAYLAGFIWINECYYNTRTQVAELMKGLDDMGEEDEELDLAVLEELSVRALTVRASSSRASRHSNNTVGSNMNLQSNRSLPVAQLFVQQPHDTVDEQAAINEDSTTEPGNELISSTNANVTTNIVDESVVSVNENAIINHMSQSVSGVDTEVPNYSFNESAVSATQNGSYPLVNETVSSPDEGAINNSSGEPHSSAEECATSNLLEDSSCSSDGNDNDNGNDDNDNGNDDNDDNDNDDDFNNGDGNGTVRDILVETQNIAQDDSSNHEATIRQRIDMPSDISTSDEEPLFPGGINNVEPRSLRFRNFNSPVPSSHRARYRREFRLLEESFDNSSIEEYRELLVVPLNRLFSSSGSSVMPIEHNESSENLENEFNENVITDDNHFSILLEEETSDEMVGNAIVDDEIVGTSIVGDEIVGDGILRDEIVGDEIVGDEIVGDEIVGDEIVGDEVEKTLRSFIKNDDLLIDKDQLGNSDPVLNAFKPIEGSSHDIVEGKLQETSNRPVNTQKSKRVGKKIKAQFEMFEYGCDSNRN